MMSEVVARHLVTVNEGLQAGGAAGGFRRVRTELWLEVRMAECVSAKSTLIDWPLDGAIDRLNQQCDKGKHWTIN